MANFSLEGSFKNAIGGLLDPTDSQANDIKNQGFAIPNAPSADGIGLPYTNIPSGVSAASPVKRHLIHWLVPDMGVVKVYVNPENITYTNRKMISNQKTKGGFNLQYWGEELTEINMRGTTGSSGIEGINVLYEVYRSEQYAFDSVGLSLAAGNAASSVSSSIMGTASSLAGGLVSEAGSAIGGALGGEIAQGIFGVNSSNNLAPRNIPSLSNNAFTVEMYYNGWVFRGYFKSMNITESTDLLFSYQIDFVATQRRGYRTNFLPWHKTPNGGGGDNSNDSDIITGTGIPYSFGPNFSTR